MTWEKLTSTQMQEVITISKAAEQVICLSALAAQ